MAPLTEQTVLDVLEALNMRLVPSQRLLPEELTVQARMLLDDLAGWDARRFLAAAKLCRRRSPWLPTTPDLLKADRELQADRPQLCALPECSQADLERYRETARKWLPRITGALTRAGKPGIGRTSARPLVPGEEDGRG
jgi:hypothetical protein